MNDAAKQTDGDEAGAWWLELAHQLTARGVRWDADPTGLPLLIDLGGVFVTDVVRGRER